MMMFFRSILFTLCFYLWSVIVFILWLPTLIMPYSIAMTFPTVWTTGMQKLLKWICGIRIHLEGLDNLPQKNGYIIASKHESALDTLLFHRVIPHAFFVFKRELLIVPVSLNNHVLPIPS